MTGAEAIILAAGRGERMRPLTDTVPKPLLPLHGKPLIEWHLEALAAGGIRKVVINTAWLEAQFPRVLGDGSRWGLEIAYSMEGRDHGGALETAGGIAKARPLLAERFWVIAGDIHAPGFRYDRALLERFAAGGLLAHLWLVPNPAFHAKGDFGIDADGLGLADGVGPDGRRWTYSSLALVDAALCAGIAAGQRAALGPLLYDAMRRRQVSVERWPGAWHNIGTPQQLAALEQEEER